MNLLFYLNDGGIFLDLQNLTNRFGYSLRNKIVEIATDDGWLELNNFANSRFPLPTRLEQMESVKIW